jgi:hypothetical protein
MRYVKSKIIDFTDREPETKVGNSTIQICPDCKRTGVAEIFYGKTYVLHAVWIISNEDGTIETEDEICATPIALKPETPK